MTDTASAALGPLRCVFSAAFFSEIIGKTYGAFEQLPGFTRLILDQHLPIFRVAARRAGAVCLGREQDQRGRRDGEPGRRDLQRIGGRERRRRRASGFARALRL